MSVNTGLAHLSDTLFTTAIAVYAAAAFGYAAEYAFGRRGRIAETTPAAAPAEEKLLVGAAGLSTADALSDADDEVASSTLSTAKPPAAHDRAVLAGRIAVVLTLVGFAVHATSVIVRGTAVDRLPWGNMY
ncbi:MAG TPA: hypothetical protein VHI14_04050 [Jatrophihabitantaceae bacterium]|nr:hypothetical protein [Jatrophihabitantaceae bacterium]